MSVPNAPAGVPPVAINPTGVGATFSGTPDAPDGVPPPAINATGDAGRNSGSSQNGPLSQLPATTSALINWTPNSGPNPTPRATTPVASQRAGILAADGTVVPGTLAPFVEGNVTVGTNQVGTSVVLTPTP